MSANLSESQRKNRNDKKRLQDLAKAILLYQETGQRIVLKKEPTPAMDIMATKYGINIYNFYHGTIDPGEQERRRLEYNTKQREANERDAIKNRGVYKGTGAQLDKKEEEKKAYFELSPEEQIAAQEKYQIMRDVQRGWRCPICKNMVPSSDELVDLSQLERGVYVELPIKSKSGDTTYPFVFHKACHDIYQESKDKQTAAVHSVNTSALLLERYKAWGKDGKKEPIVITEVRGGQQDTKDDKSTSNDKDTIIEDGQ